MAVSLKKKYVSQLNGIGARMPVSMTIFSIGALSLIGLPPFAGFISKWMLVSGALEADMLIIAAVFATSSFLNACYFLPIIYTAFFKKLPEGEEATIKEAPLAMLVPMGITAAITILLFFIPGSLTYLVNMILQGLN